MPEQRAEKSQGSFAVGRTVAVGMNGLDFLNTASMGLVNATPSRLDVHATSLESGLIRGSVAGVGSMDTGLVVTPPFGRVTVGSGGAQTSCKGMVGQKSLALGMGLIDSLMFATVGGMCTIFG